MDKKYMIYNRVSSDDQVKFGYSLESMLEKCKHYISSQDNAILIDVAEDKAYSGTLSPSKRPALNRLLEEVRTKTALWDTLLIYRLDRLSRSLLDTVQIANFLRKSNKGLESVTERLDTSTASGLMFFNVLSSINQMESNINGERTTATMISLATKKHLGGKPPLGYKLRGHHFVIDKKEAGVVRLIFEQFLILKGYNKVAKYLNEKNITTINGKKWSHRQIGLVLTNPSYKGSRTWARTNRRVGIKNPPEKWIIKESAHERIICPEVYNQIEQLTKLTA